MTLRWTVAFVLLLTCTGCKLAGPLAYYLRPRQINKPEFTFPDGARVAVLFERADRVTPMPVFEHALYEKTAAYFRQYDSPARLVPLRRVNDLRRSIGREFDEMPIQTIGRRLNADYVLNVRIEALQSQVEPGHPLLDPRVTLRTKVIACENPASDARVWPDESRGHLVEHKRQTSEYAGPEVADAELAKLGRETAYWVTLPFFPVDLEEAAPVER